MRFLTGTVMEVGENALVASAMDDCLVGLSSSARIPQPSCDPLRWAAASSLVVFNFVCHFTLLSDDRSILPFDDDAPCATLEVGQLFHNPGGALKRARVRDIDKAAAGDDLALRAIDGDVVIGKQLDACAHPRPPSLRRGPLQEKVLH